MGAAQSSQGSSVDPCVTCRTYRTCVNSSGSSKAASGQSTHIKWADSTADEAQARRAVHSCVCLLVGISIRASGLMEDTQPSSHLSANVGESGVSKWTPEPMETSLFNPPPPPLYRSFLVSEDKLFFFTVILFFLFFFSPQRCRCNHIDFTGLLAKSGRIYLNKHAPHV